MNTQIIKEYTLKEINDLAKNYKHVKVEDLNGKSITTWNSAKKPLKEHLKECLDRLNSTIVPEGYYYFCFSHATRFNKDSADKYLHCKGTPRQEQPAPGFNNNLKSDKNDLISIQSALGYITEIANLKVNNQFLEAEVKRLKDENAVLNSELEEADREAESGLSEGKTSGTIEYLKETAPALMALADRFFQHQDRKLNLEEQRLNTPQVKIKREVKTFEPGSPEHLNFIKLLFDQNKEEEFNKELDKIEILNPELYAQICKDLNLYNNEATDTK